MRTSFGGLAAISTFEGWSPTAYKDSAGLWTIGYGHLIRPNESHLLTSVIDELEGARLLQKDVRLAEDCVTANCPALEQYEFDALVSFTYNLGCRSLRNSRLLTRIKQKDKRAADELLIWNIAGGKVVRGLIRRRAIEWAMFNGREVNLV
jgi:lysozyme